MNRMKMWNRLIKEVVFIIVLLFPISVWFSVKVDFFAWIPFMLATPIVWKGFLYKADKFWRVRGKIARWMWMYFIGFPAVGGMIVLGAYVMFGNSSWIVTLVLVIGLGVYVIFGNLSWIVKLILVTAPLLPGFMYTVLGKMGSEMYYALFHYFNINPYTLPPWEEWIWWASFQLYFIVVSILVIFGSILIAKWWYWIHPRIQRYKEQRREKSKRT